MLLDTRFISKHAGRVGFARRGLSWPIRFKPDGELTPEALTRLLTSVFLEGELATRTEDDNGA